MNFWWGMLAAIVALVTSVAVPPIESPLTAEQETTPTCVSMFDATFRSDFERRFDPIVVTAAVVDARSGCTHHLHADLDLTTASTIKLHVLGAVLARHQDDDRELSATDRTHTERMMHFSHNAPSTSVLYNSVGVAGMAAYGEASGVTGIGHTPTYGITRASAADLTKVALATLHDGSPGPLLPESRQVARDIVAGVHHTQQWGISAAAADGWTPLAKNGFFPCASSNCAPFANERTWRVGSTGVLLNANAEAIGITTLTDGAQTQAEGIAAVEFVAAHIGSQLLGNFGQERSWDEALCTTVGSEDPGEQITARLGLGVADWPEIRWVSGNEGPLFGQLVCAPDVRKDVRSCICPGHSSRSSAHIEQR